MDNIILNGENEIYYEVGYSCDNSILLVFGAEKFFITDGRYEIEAKEKAKAEVVISKNLLKSAKELILKYRVKKIKIDPSKWDYKSYNELKMLVSLQDVLELSHKKREIKSEEELKTIREAVKIGAKSFEEFKSKIEFGIDEFELSYRFKEKLTARGRRELSFEPIVAIDENSAKPHSSLTEKVLNREGLLLLDAGIKYKRYCSDRTRTLSLDSDTISMGKVQKFKDPFKQKIYDIVLKAQEEAIKKVKVGVKIGELDRVAREVIREAGYGDYFVHSLGHGVGLDIHERPYINSRNESFLKEGMVFTIEPGIYLPNRFGVRIEDMILINYNGEVEVLSEYYNNI